MIYNKEAREYTMNYFVMMYKCFRCGEEWCMGHDCACDDRCPECDATNEYVAVREVNFLGVKEK